MKSLSRTICIILIAAGCIASSVYMFSKVDKNYMLKDMDEAAWIFDSYYLDSYLSGDWSDETWHKSDGYAAHPPVGKYAFGMLLHAVGQPMTSIKFSHLWQKDSWIMAHWPDNMKHVMPHIKLEQLIAGRYMACFFAIATAIAVFFIGYQLIGIWGGIASAIFFAFQPFILNKLSSTATVYTFIAFLMSASLLMAVLYAKAEKPYTKIPYALLAILLGLTFAAKISNFAIILPVIIAPLMLAKTREISYKRSALLCLCIGISFILASLLDPAMYHNPIAETLSRFAARRDILEIQKIIFAAESFASNWIRLKTLTYGLFGIGWMAKTLGVFFVIGTASMFFPKLHRNYRYSLYAFFVSLYFLLLNVHVFQMQWQRYSVFFLYFVVLTAGIGAQAIFEQIRVYWRHKRGAISFIIIAAIASALTWFSLYELKAVNPDISKKRETTHEEKDASLHLVKSLTEPGRFHDAHEYMLDYFERTGNSKLATRESFILNNFDEFHKKYIDSKGDNSNGQPRQKSD